MKDPHESSPEFIEPAHIENLVQAFNEAERSAALEVLGMIKTWSDQRQEHTTDDAASKFMSGEEIEACKLKGESQAFESVGQQIGSFINSLETEKTLTTETTVKPEEKVNVFDTKHEPIKITDSPRSVVPILRDRYGINDTKVSIMLGVEKRTLKRWRMEAQQKRNGEDVRGRWSKYDDNLAKTFNFINRLHSELDYDIKGVKELITGFIVNPTTGRAEDTVEIIRTGSHLIVLHQAARTKSLDLTELNGYHYDIDELWKVHNENKFLPDSL